VTEESYKSEIDSVFTAIRNCPSRQLP